MFSRDLERGPASCAEVFPERKRRNYCSERPYESVSRGRRPTHRVLAHKSGAVFDLQFSPVVVFRDWQGRFRALWRENRARAQYVGREERFFFTLRRVR